MNSSHSPSNPPSSSSKEVPKEGLLQSAQKSNTAWTKWGIVLLLIPLLGIGWKNFFGGNEERNESASFYTVVKGDISTHIDGDGFIESKSSYPLFFEQSGIVQKILVQEGDSVKKGDVLSSLNNTELSLEKEKARIAVETAKANLEKIKAGATQEELNIAYNTIISTKIDAESINQKNETAIKKSLIALQEAEQQLSLAKAQAENKIQNDTLDISGTQNTVQTAEENLVITQQNTETNKSELSLHAEQTLESAYSIFLSSQAVLHSSLQESALILEKTEGEGYNLGYLFSAKNEQKRRNIFTQYDILEQKFLSDSKEKTQWSTDIGTAQSILQKRLQEIRQMQEFLLLVYEGLENTIPNNTISIEYISSLQTKILTLEGQVSVQIQSLLGIIQSLESIEVQQQKQTLQDQTALIQAEKALQDAQVSQNKLKSTVETNALQTEISVESAQRKYAQAQLEYEQAQENAEILSRLWKQKITIAQNQYQNIKNTPLETDIRLLEQQIQQAQVNLEQAEYRYSQLILTAPFDGMVLSINIEKGETVVPNGGNTHILLRSNEGFVMTTNIEETEISNIRKNQTVSVYFDALENVFLDGIVSHISPISDTDSNGVVNYSVEVELRNKNPEKVLEGMTAYGKFLLDERKNKIIIPLSALQNTPAGPSVILNTGEQRAVSVGITDGKMVEVLQGLHENDIIIL